MADTLNGKQVPAEMRQLAVDLRNRGGQVFMCYPEGDGVGNCENCDGVGHFILQRVADGPYEVPPTSYAKGTGRAGEGKAIRTLTQIDGQWYRVNNLSYECPVCNGTGNRVAPKPVKGTTPKGDAWQQVLGAAEEMGASKTRKERDRRGQL